MVISGGDFPQLAGICGRGITLLMLSSERNGGPDLSPSTTDERNDLDHRIKNLTSLIEAKFLSRARFLDEFTQLRELLNAQLASAQTLVDQLPIPYSPAPDAVPVEHQNLLFYATTLTQSQP